MSGETIYPKHRQPTGQVPAHEAVAAAAADSDRQETVGASVRAPKWMLPSILALLAGGGMGSGVVGVMQATTPTSVAVLSVTKADLDTLVTQSKAQADQAAATLRAEMQSDRQATAKQFDQVAATLNKLDQKVDVISSQVVDLKVEIAGLSARRGR